MNSKPDYEPPAWRGVDGTPISCVEKIKVLNENIAELRQMAQDAFEDALLLECPEEVIRNEFHRLVDSLRNPWPTASRVGRAADLCGSGHAPISANGPPAA
jgi:hypothetical protein